MVIKPEGYADADAAVKRVEGSLKSADAQAQKVAAASAKVGQVITTAFAAASGTILGFVRSGLAGTSAGEQLSMRMSQLSREVTNLFLPAIQKVIDTLTSVVSWFKNLSGEQQNAIGKWIMLTVGALGVATILPRVISGLKGVGAAFTVLSAHPIVAVVAALGAMVAGTEEGRSALGQLFGAFKPALEAVAGLVTEIGRLFSPIIAALGEALPPLVEALVPAFEAVASVIKAIVQGITAVVRGVRSALEFLGIIDAAPAVEEPAARRQRPGEGRNELQASGKGFEGVADAFKRFQMAALKDPGQTTRERQLTVLEQIRDSLRENGRGGLVRAALLAAAEAPTPAPVGP